MKSKIQYTAAGGRTDKRLVIKSNWEEITVKYSDRGTQANEGKVGTNNPVHRNAIE
jgi:hypothetical protein